MPTGTRDRGREGATDGEGRVERMETSLVATAEKISTEGRGDRENMRDRKNQRKFRNERSHRSGGQGGRGGWRI